MGTTNCITPCRECPFRRDVRPSTDIVDPYRLIAQAHGPFVFPCHLTPGYETGASYESASRLPQCAGLAIYRSNVGIIPEGVEAPVGVHTLPADRALVFTEPAEVLAHHFGVPVNLARIQLLVFPLSDLVAMEVERCRPDQFSE